MINIKDKSFFPNKKISYNRISESEFIVDCKNLDIIILEIKNEENNLYQLVDFNNLNRKIDTRVICGIEKDNKYISVKNKLKIKIKCKNFNKLGVIGYKYYSDHTTLGNCDCFEYKDDSTVFLRGWIGDTSYNVSNIYLRFSNLNYQFLYEFPITNRYRMDLVKAFDNKKFLYSGFENYVKYSSAFDLKIEASYYCLGELNHIFLGELKKNSSSGIEPIIEITDMRHESIDNAQCKLMGVFSVNLCYPLLDVLDDHIILYINHSLGGGADLYVKEKMQAKLKEGENVYSITYIPPTHQYILKNEKKSESYFFDDVKVLLYLVSFKAKEFYFNEFVSYPSILDLLHIFRKIKQSNKYIKFTYLVHDFFCICPRLNLLNEKGEFCNLPQNIICDACLSKSYFDQTSKIEIWRNEWKLFLECNDEIICFSDNTSRYIVSLYDCCSHKIKVVPHKVMELGEVNFEKDNITTIGLLGELCFHKGSGVVNSLIDFIKLNYIEDYRIVCIGNAEGIENDNVFISTGRYNREDIPKYVEEFKIDVFFIPSIWPETFSYTVSEIISMNIPLVSFDLGAQGDKAKNYKYGKTIPLDSSIEKVFEAFTTYKKGLL